MTIISTTMPCLLRYGVVCQTLNGPQLSYVPLTQRNNSFLANAKNFISLFSVNILGGKQTNVLIFWSSLSTGAGTVVIFMFREHVSGCPESQLKQLRMFRKNATHFLLKYAPCTSKMCGVFTPKKKTSHDSMVLLNHGHVFRGFGTPNGCRPKFEVGRANAYDFAHDVGGGPTCKTKTIKTPVTIPPQT